MYLQSPKYVRDKYTINKIHFLMFLLFLEVEVQVHIAN